MTNALKRIADRSVRIITPYAKILGNGKRPIVTDKMKPLVVEALDALMHDRGPDAVLSNALGVPHLATRAECISMIRGRLGLRPAAADCFQESN